jgi:hypothetical protein
LTSRFHASPDFSSGGLIEKVPSTTKNGVRHRSRQTDLAESGVLLVAPT